MKVLVAGGAGYIGSHTVIELLKEGHDVVVLDNLSTGYRDLVHENARFYEGDITKKRDVKKIFKTEKNIDVVMHFAAKLIVPESVKKPLEYYYNNVEGLRVLLEVMVEEGVKNIVFSSTAAVYGEPEKAICEEDDPTRPINPYGESKLACERMLKWVSEAHDLNYCVFRYFNVAGADHSLTVGLKKDQLTHLVPITIQTALGLREQMTIFGDDYDTPDGTCIRDYIHVSDLAQAHVVGGKYIYENNASGTFNLGSSKGYSVLEVIEEVSKQAHVNYIIGPRREGDPAKLIASNVRAMKVLGWSPKYVLKDIITTDMAYRNKLSKGE